MNKIIGGILLIVGTSIGGGMLALPVATAKSGLLYTSILFVGIWLVMSFCAFLVLETNLWLPAGSNLISMASKTLGPWGAVISWITYLGLLYTLLCVYISGGTDIFHSIVNYFVDIPLWVSTVLFTLIFGFIVYKGIQVVDYINRGLMLLKFCLYLLLIFSILPHVKIEHFYSGHAQFLVASLMVVITSYGFAIVIPSLRSYLDSDIKKLRLIVFVGTLIPLLIYILWEAAILGALPVTGKHSLQYLLKSGHTTSELGSSLAAYINNAYIPRFANFFASICVATSFLGVALSLTDFLSDGLHIIKKGLGKIEITIIAFLPPLIIILFYPKAFIAALSIAGIFVVILLITLPVLMVWSGRYIKKFPSQFTTPGGKLALVLTLLVSLFVLTIGIIENFLV